MFYSTSFLVTLLAATSALAAPQNTQSRIPADKEVRVILSDLAETGAQVVLPEPHPRNAARPSQSGPFRTVELKLGAKVGNQDLRCQILDRAGTPIVVTRGANVDITFSDAGKGPWTFEEATDVGSIVCDNTFKKIDPPATAPAPAPTNGASDAGNEIRVQLSNQSIELGIQKTFVNGKRDQQSAGAQVFETVELRLGPKVNPAYRCQIQDLAGQPITVIRGQNVATTFGDAGKGAWTLKTPTKVSNIVCDPTF